MLWSDLNLNYICIYVYICIPLPRRLRAMVPSQARINVQGPYAAISCVIIVGLSKSGMLLSVLHTQICVDRGSINYISSMSRICYKAVTISRDINLRLSDNNVRM